MVAPAQRSIVYSFCSLPNCTDGVGQLGDLIEDSSGNLYGTTKVGRAYNQRVVFEIVQAPAPKAARPSVWHTILPAKK